MVNLARVLSRVKSLTEDRKRELIRKFEANELMEDEKRELQQAILQTMVEVETEIDTSKQLLHMLDFNQ